MRENDAVLFRRWRATGDADAFTEIVSRHAGMVFSVCRRVLGNPTDAEDAAQECFVALLKGKPKVRASLAPWLYTVAHRRAHDIRRRQAVRARLETAPTGEAVEPDPSAGEILRHVDEAIAGLPEPLQALIVERFLEGQSHTAIAAKLGVSESTVRYRLAKALERLRRDLTRRGTYLSATALDGTLKAAEAEAAPASLTAAIGKKVLAGSLAPGPAPVALVGGLLLMKKNALAVLAVLLGAAALYVAQREPQGPNAPPAPVTAAPEEAPEPSSDAEAPDMGEIALASDSEPVKTLLSVVAEQPAQLEACEIADPGQYCSVEGRVIDTAGSPVAGVPVMVVCIGFEEHETFDRAEWTRRSVLKSHHFHGVTDGDGTYAISGIRYWDEAMVIASGNGYASEDSPRVTLEPGETAQAKEIVVKQGHRVDIRVLSPMRTPVSDAVVRTAMDNSNQRAYTDSSGLCSLFLNFKWTYVIVHSKTYGTATFPELAANTGQVIELLMPRPAVLKGHIAWDDGRPAAGLRVRLHGGVTEWRERDGEMIAGSTALDHVYRTEVGASGDYEIRGIDPGQNYVEAVVEDAEEKTYAEAVLGYLKANETTYWNATLGARVRVHGVVRGTPSGEPIEHGDVTVWAVQNDHQVDRTSLREDGSYELSLPSSNEPYFICPAFEPFVHHGFENFGKLIRVAPGDDAVLDLSFFDPCTLPIHVIDDRGDPVAGAEVRSGPHALTRSGETDTDGRHICSSLLPNFMGEPAISSLVTVQKSGYFTATSRSYIGESGEVFPEETIVLYKPAGVSGVVLNADGAPLQGADVWMTCEFGDDRSISIHTETNRFGEFLQQESVPATEVRFTVSARPADSEDSDSWSLDPVVFSPGETVNLGEFAYDPVVESHGAPEQASLESGGERP